MRTGDPVEAHLVSVAQSQLLTCYPSAATFSPSIRYPEYAFDDVPVEKPGAQHEASVYGLVREALAGLGLDRGRFGCAQWNPLQSLIRLHDCVVVKPNLVRHSHVGGGDLAGMVTHGSVVRAVIDYVLLALDGTGKVVVADAPIQDADFDSIAELTGLKSVVAHYAQHGVDIDLIDLRRARLMGPASGVQSRRCALAGDPKGYTSVDLGATSFLAPIADGYRRFRVTCYDPKAMRQHHNPLRHEYLVANSVLDADVVINVPKLKTHRKVGLTCALKNVIGINGDKDWLPHHRVGSPAHGGDEYPVADPIKAFAAKATDWENSLSSHSLRRGMRFSRRAMYWLAKRRRMGDIGEGSWYGNDTVWRTVLDMNRILSYADKSGRIQELPQRRVLNIVDGIIAGEGEGPLTPTAKVCGLIIAGLNPVVVDAVAARLVGFDYRRLPLVSNAFTDTRLSGGVGSDEVEVSSCSSRWAGLHLLEGTDSLAFAAPAPWRGHIELRK